MSGTTKKLTTAFMLAIGGSAMYLVVEDLRKGILLVIGSILLDLGIDELVLMYEDWKDNR